MAVGTGGRGAITFPYFAGVDRSKMFSFYSRLRKIDVGQEINVEPGKFGKKLRSL